MRTLKLTDVRLDIVAYNDADHGKILTQVAWLEIRSLASFAEGGPGSANLQCRLIREAVEMEKDGAADGTALFVVGGAPRRQTMAAAPLPLLDVASLRIAVGNPKSPAS